MMQSAFERIPIIRESSILSLEIRWRRLENHITGRADELIFGLSEFTEFLVHTAMSSAMHYDRTIECINGASDVSDQIFP